MATLSTVYNRSVAFTTADASILSAAKMMREAHVGSLVVVDKVRGRKRLPIGIVTDRDIVTEVIATGLDPTAVTVGDIMARDLVLGHESDDVLQALEIMRFKGVRRLPVVDAEGLLVGIVTVDDVLEGLSEGLSDLAKIVARQQYRKSAERRG